MAIMAAPISPDSLERSSPSQSDDDIEKPRSKRRRFEEPTLPQTPPPEDHYPPHQEERTFNEDPQHLLRRSIVLALKHVGFDTATPVALEALCSEAESYATKFLSQITVSMLNARRSQPIPTDFEYALYKFDLPLASLRPHLNPPIPASKTQIQLEAMPVEPENEKKQKDKLATQLLGKELDGEIERRQTPWIPQKFIPFPSKHSYKWTEPEGPVKRDRRQVREAAAKESRLAEEGLRRFVKVTKSGKGKDAIYATSKDPKVKQTHELWEKVMGNLMGSQPLVAHGRNDDEDQSMIVNSESQYFRRGPTKKKAAAVELQFQG